MALLKSNRGATSNSEMPPTLPGFEHVNRYFDRQHGVYAAKILPGEYYVTLNDEMIVTVLGSCVSACIRDPRARIGGMNHFMLPMTTDEVSAAKAVAGEATRYGNFAMEHMINDILKMGGKRERLEVKLVGGGRILAQMTDVGRRNIAFVEDYVRTEGLNVIGRDLGDIYPRKVQYLPMSGKAQVKHLQSMHNNTIVERESEYMRTLQQQPVAGDVELF
ncbi:MAG: chemoreceptor glutamine deamidase CheD [Gammaproteobacteria bacterium]